MNIVSHKLETVYASAQVDKVKDIIKMIKNFEEMELEKQ